jgi:hypothetical protein
MRKSLEVKMDYATINRDALADFRRSHGESFPGKIIHGRPGSGSSKPPAGETKNTKFPNGRTTSAASL